MIRKKNYQRLVALRSFLKFCRPYRYKILFTLALFVIASVLLALIPLFIGGLVQTLTENSSNTDRIWLFVGLLIACSSVHDVFWRGAEFAYRGLVNEIGYLYETFLFRSVIYKPYPYFVDKLTGKIGSYITTISSEFKSLLDSALFDLSAQVVGIGATILILSSLNWQTGLIFILGLICMYLVGRYTLGLNMKHEAIATDIDSSKNGILFDAIANFASIKALRTEKQESRTIENEQTKTFQANQTAFLSGILFWGSMSFFVRHLMWPSVIILNVSFFLNDTLSVGQLATLLSVVLIFSSTIWEGVWYISQFGRKMAKVDEAHAYLFGLETNIATPAARITRAIPFKETITLKRLSFAYPDKTDVPILKDLSLTIKQGKKIGIVGRSGSGKSTLTKLLLDYYPIAEGQLYLDDQTVSSHEFAQLVAFVPQDTALFHRSIADNIAYGTSDDYNLEAVKAVARMAEAHEFIEKLPKKYDTLIGERGVKLSGGQRQRIAIARAMLKNAPILLLDEATSALDSESELLIQEALWKLMEGRTAIVIAHRLSTIQKMDRIIVLDEGQIVEQGSHKDLLRQNGTYAKLWAHQSGGFLED